MNASAQRMWARRAKFFRKGDLFTGSNLLSRKHEHGIAQKRRMNLVELCIVEFSKRDSRDLRPECRVKLPNFNHNRNYK